MGRRRMRSYCRGRKKQRRKGNWRSKKGKKERPLKSKSDWKGRKRRGKSLRKRRRRDRKRNKRKLQKRGRKRRKRQSLRMRQNLSSPCSSGSSSVPNPEQSRRRRTPQWRTTTCPLQSPLTPSQQALTVPLLARWTPLSLEILNRSSKGTVSKVQLTSSASTPLSQNLPVSSLQNRGEHSEVVTTMVLTNLLY